MTKLCPRGKAAAKRKFKVYPSAYANAYASKICAGKIKDPSGVKRKDFRGPKPAKAMGGRIKASPRLRQELRKFENRRAAKSQLEIQMDRKKFKKPRQPAKGMMGGGRTQMPRQMYKKGGKSFPDLSGDGKVTMKDILMGRGVIKRPKKKGGGLMEATSRLRAQGLKKGGIARGCGAVMSDRRKKTKMY
jgi:hypothetical protein